MNSILSVKCGQGVKKSDKFADVICGWSPLFISRCVRECFLVLSLCINAARGLEKGNRGCFLPPLVPPPHLTLPIADFNLMQPHQPPFPDAHAAPRRRNRQFSKWGKGISSLLFPPVSASLGSVNPIKSQHTGLRLLHTLVATAFVKGLQAGPAHN